MFKRLDLANVIELACGRGAHVPMYLDRCGHATLVDILPKNIAICRERFKGNPKVSCCANNGRDLRELPGSSFTALFTYDSMVHFEMFDVFEYLKETRRVLSPGAMALFHHSNNHGDSSLAFANAQEGRAFMSKELFGYLALRAGLEIVEQRVIDWVVKDLDCITLVRKVG